MNVVSLELANKLKEAGYPQLNTERVYVPERYKKEDSLSRRSWVINSYHRGAELIAAPCGCELLESVRDWITKVYFQYGEWTVTSVGPFYWQNKSLPDALAEMWLWLIENKKVEV